MKKRLLMVVASVLGLTGCPAATLTTAQGGPPPANVSVVNGAPKVDPDYIKVTGSNVWIYWQLQKGPYKFPDDAVIIANPDGEFSNCFIGQNGVVQDNGLRFACHDKNLKHTLTPKLPTRTYKYTITVVDGSGNRVSQDPTIGND